MIAKKNVIWLIIDIFMLLITVGFIILFLNDYYGYFNLNDYCDDVYAGIIFLTYGLMFLLSYFYPNKNITFRVLIWICKWFSNPRSKEMAFFYFTLCIIGGICTICNALMTGK